MIEVETGNRVSLPCRVPEESKVNWRFTSSIQQERGIQNISVNDRVLEQWTGRFILGSEKDNYHDLVVFAPTKADTGFYVCTEQKDHGVERHVTLIVRGKAELLKTKIAQQ